MNLSERSSKERFIISTTLVTRDVTFAFLLVESVYYDRLTKGGHSRYFLYIFLLNFLFSHGLT